MLTSMLPESFGFTNGILPILALVFMTIWLPKVLAGWIGNRQGRLFIIMLMVAVDVTLVGAALLAILTAQEDATAHAMPWDLIQRSTRLAIAWGPVWLLVWLMRAQGIERRKALAMGRDKDL
jgi:MFS family permease